MQAVKPIRTVIGVVQEMAFDTDHRVYIAVRSQDGTIERVYANMMALHVALVIFWHRAENLIGRWVQIELDSKGCCEYLGFLVGAEVKEVPLPAIAS